MAWVRSFVLGWLLLASHATMTSSNDGTFSCPTGSQDDIRGEATPLRPLKILVAAEPSPITYLSGFAVRFRMLLHYLVQKYPDDQVHLITADKLHPDPPSTCIDGKIPIHYTLGFRLPQYKAVTLSLDLSARLWRLCWQHQMDVIHVSSPGMYLIPAILTSRLQGIPLLMSYHTHLPVYMRTYVSAPWNILLEWLAWRLMWLVHSFADLTVVTSPQIADEMQKNGIGNVYLWPKGVNTTQFHPNWASREMRTIMSAGNPDDLLLVYIGRLGREKRLKDLKPIVEGLLARGISARLCIVGDGPEFQDLQNHFDGTPTTFLGSREGTELSQAFASGDIFVMPSDSETLGFVVMESMASGVPVVASRAGGLIDLVNDGETGFLVPTSDADGFVDRIVTLHQDVAKRNEMALKGRAVAETWSWEASMDFMRQTCYLHVTRNFTQRRERRLLKFLSHSFGA